MTDNQHSSKTLLFPAHIHNMDAKSPTQRSAFFYVHSPIVRAEWPQDDSEFDLLKSPNYSEHSVKCDSKGRFLKYVPNLFWRVGFLSRVFCRRKTFFFEIVTSAKFAVECTSNDIISWTCLFHLIWGLLGKNQKFSTWEKLQIVMPKDFLWKKSFHPFQKHLEQNC